jgi:hypothetical protein
MRYRIEGWDAAMSNGISYQFTVSDWDMRKKEGNHTVGPAELRFHTCAILIHNNIDAQRFYHFSN